ncbi:MAG: bifunctional phosphoglucose/phosphomannose isomerase [Thermoplasmatota archaeon]
MLDIAPDEVTRVDRSDMLGATVSLPDQIEGVLSMPAPELRGPSTPPSRVLVVGMGGSAAGGDYLAAWADYESAVPILVRRGYDLPTWVDASTLVIGVSFSGETEETLAQFHAARQKGARLAAVSTGGRLERYAAKAGAPFVKIEGGLQPRAALGRTLSAQAILLEAAGVLKTRAALKGAVDVLRAMAPDFATDLAPPRNEPKRVALALHGTIPGFYAEARLLPVARRAANQVHENGKGLAWWAEMPEMNHNELVGWWNTDTSDGTAAVFLRDRQESRAVSERWDFTAEAVRRQGVPLVQLEARGESLLARQLSLTFLADAMSVYWAIRRNIDPTPVDVITTLKKRVSSAGVVEALDRVYR